MSSTRTALVLHGGGGPATMTPIVASLGEGFSVDAPVHPGWEGTPSVPGDTIAALAGRYLAELRDRGVRDAVVVGSSIGGWIAAEVAVQDGAVPEAERVVGRLVLIDSVGVDVAGEPARDVSGLDARGLAELAWADPDRGYVDPATRTPEQLAATRGNMASLQAYSGGPEMRDSTLLVRLGGVAADTLVLWGEADRIVTPAYGRALASAIPGARFEVVADAGHLPHLEQPAATLGLVRGFVG
ncbi:pimeloyl-ACP methyl ester carboxylesterase [Frondihabitans sp. PhB188]|uniref:alpha/beta fold hydrolase n=1 Tax=Frondihabitans sp. PhB188 TaxID=2485200 RepID=UPI000F4843BC|nr:alpha/beta fold hydrolase [Frondihabitans sp. PhB188]ROQ36521.1 pimeloyl-ACP methyl ester carboxylesterase [Frondihabitans sp. PhB188]